jgi:probable rRNA maturation factor
VILALPAGPRISLVGRERFDGLPAASTLRRWVDMALPGPAQLVLAFVDARAGRRLNHDFRGRDYATNVLTFGYALRPVVHADIVLCVPVVRREARAQGKHLHQHLAHLVFHGVLHACGHDHQSERPARRMQALECAFLARLGHPDPYPAMQAAPDA